MDAFYYAVMEAFNVEFLTSTADACTVKKTTHHPTNINGSHEDGGQFRLLAGRVAHTQENVGNDLRNRRNELQT
jgi:hypothetical protein